MPGLHAQEPHRRRRLCKARVPATRLRRPVCDADGAGLRTAGRAGSAAVARARARRPARRRAPSSRRPSRTAREAARLAARAAASRIVAEREPRGQRRGVRAARSVRGAVGVALAGQLDDALAVEEDVGRLLAVPAGDHDRAAGRARGPRARAPRRRARRRRRATRASGTFGVTTVARGRSRARRARPGRPRRAAARRTRRPSPGRRRPASGAAAGRAPPRPPRSLAALAEHPDLDRVDAEVLGDGAHLGDDHRGRHGLDRGHRRPCSAP